MALKTIFHEVEFCVIGGGLAGMGAAIAAARHGIKTLLMHERPLALTLLRLHFHYPSEDFQQ